MSKFPNIEKIINHITNNDEKQKEWLLNWLAVRKQTGKKSKVGLCMSGHPGGGKGVLTHEVIGHVLNVKRVHYESVISEFWPFFAEPCDYFVFYELERIRREPRLGRIAAMLKDLVGGGKIIWNRKHKDAVYVDHSANVIIEINEPFSKIIDMIGHRRYTLIMPQRKLDPMSIDFDALRKEADLFALYLLDYPIDLEKYDTVAIA